MLRGLMMDEPLLVSSLIVHADKFHGDTEIVSRTVEGPIHRHTYRDAHRRARQLAQALGRLGVKQGERVGTLAWNGYRHFELYFAVSGMGAVIHTVNPRLFPEQIAYIVEPCRGQVRLLRPHVRAARREARRPVQGREGLGRDDRPRAHAAVGDPEPPVLRGTDRRGERRVRVAAVRRMDRGGALLHLRHDRAPEGRAVRPPLHDPARLRGVAARRLRGLRAA